MRRLHFTFVLCAGLVGCGPSAGTSVDEGTTSTSSTPTSDSGDAPTTSQATTAVDSTTSTTTSDTTTTGEVTTTSDPVRPDLPTCGPISCGGSILACIDGDDNDGDGLVDLLDPECTGVCDNSEDSFDLSPPGDPGLCTRDCFFDGNSGSGDDQCEVDLRCDSENPGGYLGCEFSNSNQFCPNRPEPLLEGCAPFCEPFVLPGCDCFGCCEIATADGPLTIFLEGHADCRLDNLAACTSCTSRIDECGNPCGECEICFGQTEPEADCRTNECDGAPTCSSHEDCACGEACHLGCCRPPPPG
jgi:hypothetical protein